MKTRATLIRNAVVTRPGRAAFRGGVLIEAGQLVRVFRGEPSRSPRAAEEIDAGGDILAPGLIDLHTHGGGGCDFLDATPEALEKISRFHFRSGVTAVLAAFSAAPVAGIASAAAAIRERLSGSSSTPFILGIYLEGPFLNPDRAGAQPERHLRRPEPKLLEELLAATGGMSRLMTIAPEITGSEKIIALLKKAGVIPAIGHTRAEYSSARRALNSGVRYATHIFNAWPSFHHRAPGAAGAVLEKGEVDTEIIADGEHLHPATVKILFRLLPLERIILVSDTVSAARNASAGKAVRLPDGRLAGGGRGLGAGFRNAVRWTGLPPEAVLRTVTLNPAALMRSAGGDIKEGGPADLTIWSRSWILARTIKAGDTVYLRK